MPRRLRPLAAAVLVAAFLAAVAFAAALPARSVAAPSVSAQRGEVQRLEGQLARLDARTGAIAEAHNRAIDRLETVTIRLREARTALARARREDASATRLLRARVRAMYAAARPSPLELVLASGSIEDAARVRDLMDQIARQDAGTVDRIRVQRRRAAALTIRLADDRRAAEEGARQLAERRRELAAAVAARQALLAGARRDLRRAIAAERERRRRQAALLAAQRAQAASGLPYTPGASQLAVMPAGGSYVFPVSGGARYSDDWLAGRAGGRLHQGIDLFAAAGTPLVAVADGSVFRVGWNGLGGWRLWLRDRSGTEFYYAHLAAFAPAAREGAAVSRGTVLGYVGTTGDAQGTSPHVHFEIHPGGGGPVRPFPIVSAWPVVR